MKDSPAQPATAAMQLASLPSHTACNRLTRNTGPDLSCKQEEKGGSKHASIFCSPSLLLWMEGRKEIVEERWKNACQESAGERELRLILMQRVAEKETESRTRLIGRWLGFLVPSVNII